MQATLIRVFIWPRGIAALVGICLLSLLLLHWPNSQATEQAKGPRDEFPGQRRGGGTHWVHLSWGDTMA
jgi:hypothetical protein